MRDKVSLEIDMDNALNQPHVDNFTVLLLRLIMKSDSNNRYKLSKGFPVEVMMVKIFQTDCPYLEALDADGNREVDYKQLVERAIDESGEGTWDCGYCGLSGQSNRPPFDTKCIRCKGDKVHATAPVKPWPEEKQ